MVIVTKEERADHQLWTLSDGEVFRLPRESEYYMLVNDGHSSDILRAANLETGELNSFDKNTDVVRIKGEFMEAGIY